MTFTGQAFIYESQTRPYTATFSCPGNLTGGTAEIVHITTSPSDVTVDGTFTVASGSATVNVSCLTDQVPEGNETFRIRLKDNSGNVLGESFVITIGSNSAQYALSGPLNICEGGLRTYTVQTNNVPNGTVVSWQINHITTSAADFFATSGTVTINGGQGTFSVSVGSDLIADPNERFSISLLSGGQTVATSANITIAECSQPPSNCSQGGCSWQWKYDGPVGPLHWEWDSGDCPPAGSGQTCECPAPSFDGSFVGQLETTFCEANPLP